MNDEHNLWIASRRYITGEISIEELKAVEKSHNDAFEQALYVLAKRSLRRKFWRWIRR